VNRTIVLPRTTIIRRRQRRRWRAQPGSIRRTDAGSAAEGRLAQLARFGLAITGKPLLELKPEDA
jgi:hypothetical protein